MLYLLDTPCWRTDDTRADLPDTLPGWCLAFLALQRGWVPRERLCALLWPDAAPAEAQHNLRANLYRLRALLAGWGMQQALQTERKRVRLELPNDVAALREALARPADAASLLRHRRPLLTGMSFGGFAALRDWAAGERGALQAAWRDAALSSLAGDSLPAALAAELCQLLMHADPLDEAALTQQMRLLAAHGRSADAMRLFQQFRERLHGELGLAPAPALAAWVAGLSGAAVAGANTRDAFVGREIELAQLAAMLDGAPGRVVTLKGPGGVGKSRLAREIASRIGSHWRDGPLWMPLSDLMQASAVLPRLAEQIGLAPAAHADLRPALSAAMAARTSLVVFDNAEHLDDFVPLLAELQRASPASTWLVTSRSPLGLAGERSYTLDGLQRPPADERVADAGAAAGFDAMRLLVSRVHALDPGFDLAAQWRDALAIVHAVGGWPLAIELAAPAIVQQGAAAVRAELEQSIDTLAAGRAPAQARHDSVRAPLLQSWQRLAAAEQRLLARLGVFRGGFTRVAALAVGAGEPAAFARLVERSLVQVAAPGRFELHPLVARFAAERLAVDDSERADAERRHAEHFVARLHETATTAHARMPALLDEIGAAFEDHRQAWATLVRRGDATRLGAAAPAWSEFGTARGRTGELIEMVSAALPVCAAGSGPHNALLQALATLHYRGGEFDSAQALAREACAAATRAGDGAGARAMLNSLALSLRSLGRYREAEQHAQEALRLARAAGVEREIASHANTCAMLAKMRGDHAAAAALYEQAIAIHRRSANPRGLAICLNNLGNVHRALDDDTSAQHHFEECLRITEQHGIASTRAYALVNLALVHERSGRGALARAFAERARAEPAAETAVLTAADTVIATTAIDAGELQRGHEALCALARRARSSGLHAAVLDTVRGHARLLAALGRREAAIARLLFLAGHPQLPAMQRAEIEQAVDQLQPSADERARAQAAARAFELEILLDSVSETID